MAGERDEDLKAREAEVTRLEAALAERAASAEDLIDAAVERDADADQRDEVAIERDRQASLAAFTTQDGPYLHDLEARRDAALNRMQSKDDRTSFAEDRDALRAEHDSGDDAADTSSQPH